MKVVGFTGSFGSGCTKLVKDFVTKRGYQYLSLSAILKDLYSSEKGGPFCREDLQNFGDELREKNGSDFLAKEAFKIIEQNGWNEVVIDSIRNPGEINYFSSSVTDFFLFGIYADQQIRWERVREKYRGNMKDFERDDERDKNEKIDYGQRITDCFIMADFIILNNEPIIDENEAFRFAEAKFNKYFELIDKKSKFEPEEHEALMAMAYANSLRSNCLKRKVGALVVDTYGNIFSSGYNEVPWFSQPCKKSVGGCYRDHLKNKFATQLQDKLNDPGKIEIVKNLVHENFKGLDYCRSLHAEENALVNISRFGSSSAIENSTIYTTTYPCNLCANKIVQTGIKKVVYLEPYPMKEAKEVFKEHKIVTEAFEGVLFNGYFRFLKN